MFDIPSPLNAYTQKLRVVTLFFSPLFFFLRMYMKLTLGFQNFNVINKPNSFFSKNFKVSHVLNLTQSIIYNLLNVYIIYFLKGCSYLCSNIKLHFNDSFLILTNTRKYNLRDLVTDNEFS